MYADEDEDEKVVLFFFFFFEVFVFAWTPPKVSAFAKSVPKQKILTIISSNFKNCFGGPFDNVD